MVLGLVAALGAGTAAHAGDGPFLKHQHSICSSIISGKVGGGKGTAQVKYDSYRATTRKFVIEYANSWADQFQQCATSTAVQPYKITTSLDLIQLGYMEFILGSGSSFANYVLGRTCVTVVNTSGDKLGWCTGWI